MKSTGIVRKIDDLGRIVIPKEIRKTFGIKEYDAIEIYTEGESIVLKKYKPIKVCGICGSDKDVVTTHDKEVSICKVCATKVSNMFGE